MTLESQVTEIRQDMGETGQMLQASIESVARSLPNLLRLANRFAKTKAMAMAMAMALALSWPWPWPWP